MFLIDGYNLLHVVTRGRTGSEARDHLIGLLETHCRQGGYHARIVFDPTEGLRRREQRGEVEVRCVMPGRTADDEILAVLASTDDQTAHTLVSNDRALVREAEKRGVRVVTCQEFAELLLKPPPVPEEDFLPSPGEVDYWMKEFGLEEDPPA